MFFCDLLVQTVSLGVPHHTKWGLFSPITHQDMRETEEETETGRGVLLVLSEFNLLYIYIQYIYIYIYSCFLIAVHLQPSTSRDVQVWARRLIRIANWCLPKRNSSEVPPQLRPKGPPSLLWPWRSLRRQGRDMSGILPLTPVPWEKTIESTEQNSIVKQMLSPSRPESSC